MKHFQIFSCFLGNIFGNTFNNIFGLSDNVELDMTLLVTSEIFSELFLKYFWIVNECGIGYDLVTSGTPQATLSDPFLCLADNHV